MKDTSTLPASIRQRLELARDTSSHLPEQGQHLLSAEVGSILARNAPEVYALIKALESGRIGIAVTEVRERQWIERVDRSFLGIPLRPDYYPMHYRETTTRILNLF